MDAKNVENRADEGRSMNRTQTSIAVDRIRSDIIRGQLQPMAKLRVQSLANHYQVAASAVREALSRLVTDGLVDVEDQRGFRVSAISKKDLIDLTETRIGIECLAIGRAIEFGDFAWEGNILAAFHRLSHSESAVGDRAVHSSSWVDHHKSFHETLISACASEWLSHFCSILYQQTERYRSLWLATIPVSRDPLKEHAELKTAVIARDKSTACTLLKNHYRETTEAILAAAPSLNAIEMFGQAQRR